MTTFIIIGIVLLLVLWVIGVQRKLVRQEELCKNAMSQIGVQQSSRWDALSALAELTKSYNEHEYETLKSVIAQRANISGTSKASEADAQEGILTQALSRIVAVAEQYPDLKANQNYAKTMDSVNMYENQVRTSRMVFNDTVTKFNNTVRMFPDSLIAGMLGFTQKEYLKENEAKADMPSMKF